ncbi:hypothetical protein FPV67DRAFT_1631903 [Lyophyllum atratum]|nr:hypothetical protein FPV67DRAFT_1631903 [Lyophyllum atratum]
MDFFTAVHQGKQPPAPTDDPDVAVFAGAIASRYGAADATTILRARLTPVTEIPMPMPMPESTLANMSLAPTTTSPFKPVVAADLAEYLNDPHTLIVDIRPHAAYNDARLPRALSLSVPSTLLKRPLFSLERLAAMLPSPSDRTRFTAFREFARIVVYDADAVHIPESSNIHGLLRKFKAAAYPGELSWLRGGFQGVWREQRHLVDTGPQAKDQDEDDDQDSGPALTASPAPPAVLRTKHLPMSAFSLSSTTASQDAAGPKRRPPTSHRSSMSMHMSLPMPTSQPIARPAINPFFDTIRQNFELSHGITERIPLRLPARVRRRIADLPFPWLREIALRADKKPHILRPHHRPSALSISHPHSDAVPTPAFIEEGTEALAMQFYRIELAEQRRLMGVMEHHSKESGRFVIDGVYEETHASLVFPFSITAGVEKGAKNRYRNIWPFEHARVRLDIKRPKDGTDKSKIKNRGMNDDDDYVNASYVQPLGTNRRYIATQGPLDATFDDFWRLTWEQNVHVIVMLTKEIEGSMVKCGAYWADTKNPASHRAFGPLRLTLVSKVGLPAGIDLMHEDPESAGVSTQDGGGPPGGFAFPPQSASIAHHNQLSRKRRVSTIKRTFTLSHVGYPHLGARTVVQLQYLDWPDMNVPDDARGVLDLVKELESAVSETDHCVSPVPASPLEEEEVGKDGGGKKIMQMDPGSGIARHALGGCRPVLLHCSAGVGRTGGFIAVDAVLDAVRREMQWEKEVGKASASAMDVDELPSVTSSVVAPGGQNVDGMVTVPLHVAGNSSLGTDAGDSVDSKEGFVVHVPAVVVPTSAPPSDTLLAIADVPLTDTAHTPMQAEMQVDGDEGSPSAFSEQAEVRPNTLTRWAEGVSGSYESAVPGSRPASASGSNRVSPSSVSPPPPPCGYASSSRVPIPHAPPEPRQQHQLPPAHKMGPPTSSTSGSSVSTFPSISDSEGSPRTGTKRPRGGSVHAPHLIPGPRPLSRSSPPLTAPGAPELSRAEPSPPPLTYARDPRVSSSFPERPATTVDYKEPRALHGAREAPVALSAFEEPIWEVLQDMREQRMSLCQSLRQYVFVHAAIIEGALWVVDEEREKESRENAGLVSSPMRGVSRPSLPPLSLPPVPQIHAFNSTSSGVMSDSGSTSSTGKRGASPTELLKEGKKGEVLLSKRPSIKRRLQLSSPIGETETGTGRDVGNASPGTGPTVAGSPLQQVLGTVPSSPMPCE